MFVVLIQNLEEIPSEFPWKILHGTFFQIVDRMDRVHRACSNATFRIVLASSRCGSNPYYSRARYFQLPERVISSLSRAKNRFPATRITRAEPGTLTAVSVTSGSFT